MRLAYAMMRIRRENLVTPLANTNTMIKVGCLLRTHRKRWKLSQKELAALVPKTGENRVSYVERKLRPPNAREILAYRLIFDVLPEELFPRVVSDVEEAVVRKAYSLHRKLKKEKSEEAKRRRAFLEAILVRAANRARTHFK